MRIEIPYPRAILNAIESLKNSLLCDENSEGVVGMSMAYRTMLESTIIPLQHCNTVIQELKKYIAEIERFRTSSDIEQVLKNLREGCTAVEQQKYKYTMA